MKTQVIERPSDVILRECNVFLGTTEKVLLTQKLAAQQSDWLSGRYVLKTFFRDSHQLNVPLSEIEVLYKGKRPIIVYNNEVWLASISHSQRYVAVCFSKDTQPGIDIEELVPRSQQLQEYIMNDSEQILLPNGQYKTAILWTMKEAAFKADSNQVTVSDYELIKRLSDSEYVVRNTKTDTTFVVTTTCVANYVVSYTLYLS